MCLQINAVKYEYLSSMSMRKSHLILKFHFIIDKILEILVNNVDDEGRLILI